MDIALVSSDTEDMVLMYCFGEFAPPHRSAAKLVRIAAFRDNQVAIAKSETSDLLLTSVDRLYGRQIERSILNICDREVWHRT